MITYLISTTEFVQEIDSDNTIEQDKAYELIIRYTNFISQKPELWMFVPCNELNEPYPNTANEYWKHKKGYLAQQYKVAKSKVLFKDWVYIINEEWDQSAIANSTHSIILGDTVGGYKTIEILASKVKLELTETALKQIGL